jgi:hypothetical protein
MKLSPDLHKAVLAGMARAPIGDDATDTTLAGVLPGTADPLVLWHAVAATDLRQRAGFIPLQAPRPAPACQDASTCPSAAEQILSMILRGIHAEQLDNWLALARWQGMALPHGALAPLLDRGLQKPALRTALIPLLGPRGRWLLTQHPAWAEAYGGADTSDTTETQWQLGQLAQRCDALRAMRRADSAAALTALAAEWAQEPPEHRVALLACLEQGLSPIDEAFLENALDDKRKEVRAAARQLLAKLPGSQLAERCKARLAAVLTLERQQPGSLPQLTICLPAACDGAMRRDGIGAASHRGLGEKAGWLLDMMAVTPPTHWTTTWRLTPLELFAVLAATEFAVALLSGLAQAAAHALAGSPAPAATDCFIALIKHGAPAGAGIDLAALLLPSLWRLSPRQQEEIVLHWLAQPPVDARGSGSAIGTVDYVLDWAAQRFSGSAEVVPAAVSRLLLEGVQRHMALAMGAPDYQARRTFAVLAQVLDPAVLAGAHAGWPAADWPHWPQWRSLTDELMETLEFRKTMQASFLETEA